MTWPQVDWLFCWLYLCSGICRATTPLKNWRPSKPIFFLKTLLLQLLFMCLWLWWSIVCQNVSSSVTSYITSLFRKRFDRAWLSDFLGNLLHLIIVPQLQWNLICLKWVEILEHNIWRKRLKQRLFNIHSSELWRKKKQFLKKAWWILCPVITTVDKSK